MNTYVVTDVEAGRDCVEGVYKAESEEKVKEYLLPIFGLTEEQFEDKYAIHLQNILKI